jgi:hypothetical protein
MEYASVLGLKEEILNSLISESLQRASVGHQSIVNPRIESRLSVGYSRKSDKDFWLELRVQRGGRKAFRKAEEIKSKAKGEANIEVIPIIEIPSKSTVFDSKGWRELKKKKRPLHIGLSVGHIAGGAGTLGAFVEVDEGVAILSNNHVLALMGQAEVDEGIYQPGKPDKPNLFVQDKIAKLFNFGELTRRDRNSGDSAIALLLPGVDYISNQIPTGFDFPMEGEFIKDLRDPQLLTQNKTVCKVGRTTGFTRGLISAIALDNVPVRTTIGNVIFDDVIEINWLSNKQPFSKPGDSGSLVFTEEERAAIGLHFAGGTKKVGNRNIGISYSCAIENILDGLDADLLGE